MHEKPADEKSPGAGESIGHRDRRRLASPDLLRPKDEAGTFAALQTQIHRYTEVVVPSIPQRDVSPGLEGSGLLE